MRAADLVLGATGIVLFAGAVLAFAPELQLGRVKAAPGLVDYRPREAHGRALYVDLGCVYCHSQQPRDPRQAPDGERGWGRASTPGDYIYDSPHLLGTMRTGPDLLNIGARQPSEDWHLLHLYQPRAVVPGSIMPAYPFLFDDVPRATLLPGQRELVVASPHGVPLDRALVATEDALDLVAYLKSLNRTYVTAELAVAPPSASTTTAAKKDAP